MKKLPRLIAVSLVLLITNFSLIGCSHLIPDTDDSENLYMQELWFNEKLWVSPTSSMNIQKSDYMRCMSEASKFEQLRSIEIGHNEENQNDNMKANVEICMLNKGYLPKVGSKPIHCEQAKYSELPVCKIFNHNKNIASIR